MKSEIKQTLSSISEQTSKTDTATKLCFLYILYKLLKLICRLPHNNDNFEANGHMACTLNLYKHTFKNDNIDTCIRKIFNHIFFFFQLKKNTLVCYYQMSTSTCNICSTQYNSVHRYLYVSLFHEFESLVFFLIFINDKFIFWWKVWKTIMHRNLTILLFFSFIHHIPNKVKTSL